MSGHSKWSTIKHKKGAQDAKRGKIFSKIIKEITIAARLGDPNPDNNPRLRSAIMTARVANMPKDNIERAIKKGSGSADGVDYVELHYEGYGPGGIAIIVEAMTDNKNRTAADIRNIFTKHGGNLGEHGCVSYMFKKQAIITYQSERYEEDALFERALESGAEDIEKVGDLFEVTAPPSEFERLLDAMQSNGFEHDSAGVENVADNSISLERDVLIKSIKLIETLEDHEDVQQVSTNIDIPDDFEME